MFGMSFTEILIIAVIAIIFLGPDKLPNAMVQVAKFFKSFKKSISEAKETIDHELKIQELKDEALSYKKKIESAASEIKSTAAPLEEIKNTALLDELDEIKNLELTKEGNSKDKKNA